MEYNGYKIRYDLINMAKDMLMEEWNCKRLAAEQTYYQLCEIERRRESVVEVPFPTPNPLPSSQQIIALAQQLNDFVSRKL